MCGRRHTAETGQPQALYGTIEEAVGNGLAGRARVGGKEGQREDRMSCRKWGFVFLEPVLLIW